MANQYIINYLNQNKDKFNIETLKKKLIGAGYPEKEIEDAIKIIQQPVSGTTLPQKPSSFWDFKSKKVYVSGKEKLLDFIGGIVFVNIIIFLGFFSFLRISSFLIGPILIGIIIYFFIKRRGYISWGIILGSPFSGILFFLFYFLSRSF